MKTTLAILGIFAAAVLATSFVASGYALSQSTGASSSQSQSSTQGANHNAQAGIANTNGNFAVQKQKAFVAAGSFAGCSLGAIC